MSITAQLDMDIMRRELIAHVQFRMPYGDAQDNRHFEFILSVLRSPSSTPEMRMSCLRELLEMSGAGRLSVPVDDLQPVARTAETIEPARRRTRLED